MKKIIPIISALVLTLLLLASCGGGGNETTGAVFFDPESIYYVFANTDDNINVGDITDRVFATTGVRLNERNMNYAESLPREVVFGDGEREVTRAARAYLDGLMLGEDDGAFVIYTLGNSVAVYYNTDYAVPMAVEYFLEEFVTEKPRTVLEDGCFYKKVFSIEEYKEEEWESRWSVLEGKISDKAIEAMKRLYGMFGADTYTWLADLYDPEIGGFYYSNSARDHVGFLPDVESTRQALVYIQNMGMITEYGSLEAAVPEALQAKMVEFVKSMQDENDGYFYHTQWGKRINTSRRGRDLTWSIYILTQFGEKPNYKTPMDMLGDSELVSSVLTRPLGVGVRGAVSGLVRSCVTATATNEEAPLDSWESLKAYLDKMDFANDSHAQGQILGAQSKVIAAAGYSQKMVEYMDAKQDPTTGLWESTVTYRSIGGLLKISSAYSAFGGEIKYAKQAMDSCVEMLLSDEPQTSMTGVYNCLNGMGNVMGNLSRFGGKSAVAEMQEYLRGRAEEIINASIEKIHEFQKEDGSFSYQKNGASTHSQGALVALGVNEGDVNATLLAAGVITGLCDVLGIPRVRVYNGNDFKVFIDRVMNMPPVEKLETEPPEPITFDDCSASDDFPLTVERDELENGDLEIVNDPRGEGKVIALNTVRGQGDYFHVRVERVSTLSASCFVLESDMCFAGITANSNPDPLQLFLRSARSSAKSTYMVTFNVKGEEVKLYDLSYGDSDGFKTDLLTTIPKNDWFKLRIEYYVEDPENVLIKIYVNGELKKISNNYFGPRASYGKDQPMPNTDYMFATFYAVKSSDGRMLFDNILVDKTNARFSSEGYTGEIGGGTKDDFWDSFGVNGTEETDGTTGFEELDPSASLTSWSKNTKKVVSTYASTGTESFAVKSDGAGNKYIGVNKTQTGASVLVIKAAEGEANANCYVFEADIKWNVSAIGSGIQFSLSDGTVNSCKTENSKVVSMIHTNKCTFGSSLSTDSGGVQITQSLLSDAIASGNRFRIRIEYYEDVKMAKIYINGALVLATNSVGTGTAYTHAVIYLTNGFKGEVEIDNVTATKLSKTYDPSEKVEKAPVYSE